MALSYWEAGRGGGTRKWDEEAGQRGGMERRGKGQRFRELGEDHQSEKNLAERLEKNRQRFRELS